jgi:hypothetical protein
MKQTAELTKVEIVVYVIATLGGAERTVYSEDIAARSYELAASSFSWRRQPYIAKGWPDKYIAKTALEDAKKPEYGSLVEGVYALDLSKDGWRLTPQGAKWFRENSQRIESALNVKQPAMPKREADRFKRRLREQSLFRDFVRLGKLQATSWYSFTDMLNCSPDAAPEVVAMKFRRMKAMAELIQDPTISEFVAACEASFPHLASGAKEEAGKEAQ